jgi:predicted transcriptional regulator
MTHSDKILAFLKEKPAASTEEIHQFLKKNGISSGKRTIQREIRELADQKLIQGHAIGREIVYSLITSQSTTVNDYFLSKYWELLFDLQSKLSKGYLNSTLYFELRNLVLMLPDDIKNQVKPTLDSITNRIKLNHEGLGVEYFGFDPNAKKDAPFTHSDNLKIEASDLLGEIASLLHRKER